MVQVLQAVKLSVDENANCQPAITVQDTYPVHPTAQHTRFPPTSLSYVLGKVTMKDWEVAMLFTGVTEKV